MIRERIDELRQKHGALRTVARVLECDHTYLHRLFTGEKTNPSRVMLRKLGLREVRTYERTKP